MDPTSDPVLDPTMTPEKIVDRLRDLANAFDPTHKENDPLANLVRDLCLEIEADARVEAESREQAQRDHQDLADKLRELAQGTPGEVMVLPDKPNPVFQVDRAFLPTVVQPPCWVAPTAKPDTVEITRTIGPSPDFPFKFRPHS